MFARVNFGPGSDRLFTWIRANSVTWFRANLNVAPDTYLLINLVAKFLEGVLSYNRVL